MGFLGSHMVNLAVGEILLPLQTLLLTGSLIRLPGGTIISHVACQSTLETRTKSLTSLRGDILLVRGWPNKKPIVHSNWVVAQLVELPVAGDGTLDTRDAASESWDPTSGTGNTGSRIADAELASVHDPEMGF
jgi:hypothetical protein